jgi:hypothetical protein
MSLGGNSRISEVRSSSEALRRSRAGDLANSSDLEQTRASVNRLRTGLETGSSGLREGPGYVNGQFSVRNFLDGIGDRFTTGVAPTERSEAKKAELEKRREDLRKEIKHLETRYIGENDTKKKLEIEEVLVLKNQTLEEINYQLHLFYGQDLVNDNTGFIEKQRRVGSLESRKKEIDTELARISSPVIPRRRRGRTRRNPNHDPQRTEQLRKELTDLNSEIARLKG